MSISVSDTDARCPHCENRGQHVEDDTYSCPQPVGLCAVETFTDVEAALRPEQEQNGTGGLLDRLTFFGEPPQ